MQGGVFTAVDFRCKLQLMLCRWKGLKKKFMDASWFDLPHGSVIHFMKFKYM